MCIPVKIFCFESLIFHYIDYVKILANIYVLDIQYLKMKVLESKNILWGLFWCSTPLGAIQKVLIHLIFMEDLWESIRLSFEGEHDVHYSSLMNLKFS